MKVVIDGRPYITAQEAAYRLGKSIGTVFRVAKEGAFKTHNIHAQFVDEAQFEAWQKGSTENQ